MPNNPSAGLKLLITAFFLLITACAQDTPKDPLTMRICDENGCADRPKNYATVDPANTPQAAEDIKIRALEQMTANDPRAAYDLALRFFRGDGVRQDSYLAIKWMRDAAEKGNFDAQKALGRLYLTGLGEMGADPGEAERWLSMTASKGDKEAAQLLSQASAAKQANQAGYQVYDRWRRSFTDSWLYGYRYNWYWGSGRWSLYR
ncbi:MAG: tetratricopeptide repeat protein [Methylococcales bacterium]|nr:tetratricopeptide repeat protein [Methylococcales bacterium]